MQDWNVLLVIPQAIIQRRVRIAIPAIKQIILTQLIQIISQWVFQQHVLFATIQRVGALHHIQSMIRFFPFIPDLTRGGGTNVLIAILIRITMPFLIVRYVIQMHMKVVITPMLNVIIVIPEEQEEINKL
jgi:hypothetical protein